MEEHEFDLKEAKEKIQQEFKDKLIEDDLILQRMKRRFLEYKEGMSFDVRRFIETEKYATLKAIIEKKNNVFITSPALNDQKPGQRKGACWSCYRGATSYKNCYTGSARLP